MTNWNPFLLARHVGMGVLFAFFLGGSFGFSLGVFISWVIPFVLNLLEDKGLLEESYEQNNVNSELMLEHFFNITFEVLGHLSKSKGVITQLDIEWVENVMDRMRADEDKRALAQTCFNLGKDANYPLRQRLNLLRNYYSRNPALLEFFMEIQIDAACIDGNLHPNELKILSIIIDTLNISQSKLEQQVRARQATFRFHQRQQQEQSQRYSREQQQQSRYQQREQGQPDYSKQRQIHNAYVALGIGKNAGDAEIKHAYRKLMNAHHPDKLVSRGLPPEMMDIAKQKTQEIQAAYEIIKNKRGFK